MPEAGWTKMSENERGLAKKWYSQGKKPSEIGELLGRDTSSVTRLLCLQKPVLKQGRPCSLTMAQVDFLEKKLDDMIVKANGQRTVTVQDLKKTTKTKASCRSILRALHDRNIYFRKLREKPLLTPEDVRARFHFAKKYRSKSRAWWVKNVDAFIDGKHFQVGVGKGKAVTVHEVTDGRWSGQAAASFYHTLARDLKKASPAKRRFTILEDNDPTGYKSAKGIAAKCDAGLLVFEIPKRSPDLSVLDYAIWTEINKRLRRQESKWTKGKKETRAAYIKRLKLTARSLPKDFILNSIGDMARRCQRLYEAKGYFFEEGGSDP
ncbi:Ikbke [Symbiodinium natans]|uniref:Ikbke protein n=1 Tax=Symbiodinium natans TaxID=878477 RepID=A0A812S299_9DINO|nr:Ikbke [Symbiodinium natans]